MAVIHKGALIDKVAERTELSKKDVEKVLKGIQEEVISSVVAGDEVKVTGFVSFTPSVRAPRTGRHPRTGESIEIPATKVVSVSASSNFRTAVKESGLSE